mmetsp:Transcript_7659/g.19700  ORF Transcript_7659/g.19700 Transcript_7659/m.19700 type:complete len:105 (+) Transcript_7659:280-594(+)
MWNSWNWLFPKCPILYPGCFMWPRRNCNGLIAGRPAISAGIAGIVCLPRGNLIIGAPPAPFIGVPPAKPMWFEQTSPKGLADTALNIPPWPLCKVCTTFKAMCW